MILKCAWCNLDLGEVPGPVDAVSHGICLRCKALLMERLDDEKNKTVLLADVGDGNLAGRLVGGGPMLKRLKTETVIAWVVCLALFVAFGIVGEMDYQDAVTVEGQGAFAVAKK